MKEEWNHPTKPVVERGKRNAFADAYRAVANMRVKDLQLDPEDTVPVAMAKVLALEALACKVNAAAEFANRAEGKPSQVVQYEPGESAKDEVGLETLAMIIRIGKARCEAYGMEPPSLLVEAQRQIEAERQAAVDAKAERDVPPPDSSSGEEP